VRQIILCGEHIYVNTSEPPPCLSLAGKPETDALEPILSLTTIQDHRAPWVHRLACNRVVKRIKIVPTCDINTRSSVLGYTVIWLAKGSQKDERRYRYEGIDVRMYIKVRECRKGQTMTEYALILAAVAIVVFITYEVMGQDIGTLVSNIDNALTTT